MAELPEGFELDPQGPPEGFTIDKRRPGWKELGSDLYNIGTNVATNAANEAWRTTKETVSGAREDLGESLRPREVEGEGFWEGYAKDVANKPAQFGKFVRGLAGVASTPTAPIVGAAKSVIGRPMAEGIHAVGRATGLASEEQSPKSIYEDIRDDVGTALGTTRPAGWQGRTNVVATKTPDVPAPSLAERKTAASNAYNHTAIKTAEIRPQAVRGLANSIESDLISSGYLPDPASAPGTFRALARMRPAAGQNAPVTINELDVARRGFSKYARQVDAVGAPTSEAAAAAQVVSHIDKYLLNLKQSDLLAGSANRIGKILGEARTDWASYKRGQLVDTLEANANAARASTYGGGNYNNAIRQKFRPLTMNNQAGLRGWSPEAKEAFANVVSGGKPYSAANITRQIGRYVPSGNLGAATHIISAVGTGGLSIPVGIAADVARRMGIALTRRNVEKVRDILAKESNLYKTRQASAVPTPKQGLDEFIPLGWGEISEPTGNPYHAPSPLKFGPYAP